MRLSTWSTTFKALPVGRTDTEVTFVARFSAARPVDALISLALPKGAELVEGLREQRMGSISEAEVYYRVRMATLSDLERADLADRIILTVQIFLGGRSTSEIHVWPEPEDEEQADAEAAEADAEADEEVDAEAEEAGAEADEEDDAEADEEDDAEGGTSVGSAPAAQPQVLPDPEATAAPPQGSCKRVLLIGGGVVVSGLLLRAWLRRRAKNRQTE